MELGVNDDNLLPSDILHQLCSTIVQEIEEIRQDTLVDHEMKRKLVVYFMDGNGSKLLQCLIKHKEFMTENMQHLPEVCFLCLQVLLYEPPPCHDYCPAATDRYLDNLRSSGSSRTCTMSHNYMRSYCEMRTIKDKLDRGSNKKRKEKLQKLVLRHETVATSTSSSSDEGVSERPVRNENRRLKVITTPDLDEKPKKLETCEPSPALKTRQSSNSSKLKETANSIVDACSEFPGFKCPCELAQVLLDMLVASFTSSLDSNPPPSHSPMSLAVQLVTAITVMQQSNVPTSVGDDDKGLVSNDELICNISHKETRWSQQSVMHLRRLILRTVIELCNAGVRNHDFKEIAQNDILSSLLKLSSEMLERDYSSREVVPVADANKAETTGNNKQQQQLPSNLLFATETMRGILLVLTAAFKQHFRTFDEMEPAVRLLHEFDWCGGYRVFTDLLVRVGNCSCSDVTQSARAFRQLLNTFEDLLSAVQNVKVSLLHRTKCSRQNHRSCEFLNLIPMHCDTMGLEISPTCSAASSKTCEDREACTVAVAVRFVINLMLKVTGPCIGDVVSTLDRVCLCRCQSPADWLVPLICCLPRWAAHTQKAVLAVISKLMIYHFDDTTAHEQKKSTTVFCFPVSWVISILEQEKLYKTTEAWKCTTPCKMLRTASCEHHLNDILQLISHFFSANHKIDRWLALSLYRILLQSSNVQLTSAILQHLQRLVPHGVKQTRVGLLTNVFLPIIGSFSGQSGRLVDRKVLYTRDVFIACMEMTLRCLETEQHCKRLFVRHGGVQALNLVLKTHGGGGDKSKTAAECELNHEDADARALAIEMVTLLFGSKMQLETRSALMLYTMRPSLSLSNNSNELLLPPSSQPKNPLSAQNSLDAVPPVGSARSFFRGFSFSWGGDKRRVLDEIKDRVVPVDGDADCHAVKSAFERHTISIDEVDLFRGESRKFVRSALIRIGRLPMERGAKASSAFNMLSDRGATWAAKHLSRLNMHTVAEQSNNDSESDAQRNYMSETSGYRSTTAFDSLDESRRPSGALPPATSVSTRASFDASSTSETLTLPLDTDIDCWRKMDECWRAIGAAVCRGAGGHDDGFGVAEFFVEVGGVDASLKLVGNLTRRFSSLLVASDDGTADDEVDDGCDALLDVKLQLFSRCLRICFEFSKNPKKTTISSDEVTSVIKAALRGKLNGYEVVRKLFETILLTCLQVDQAQEKRQKQAEHKKSRSHVLTLAQRMIDSGGMSGATNGCEEGRVPRPNKSINSSNDEFNGEDDEGRWQDEKYLSVRHRKYDASLDGYDGDSDSDALFQKCNDESATSANEDEDRNSIEEFDSHAISPHSDLLVHPQLLLLVIDLLGKTEQVDDMDNASTNDECLWNEQGQLQTRRLLLLQLLTFVRALIKRKAENVDILCTQVDFASACLYELQDVIHMKDPAWDDVRELLFSLCMTCNKKFMTSKHLRGILSLFNGKHPPLQDLVEFLDELSTHEEFGPNTCLEFSSSPSNAQKSSPASTPAALSIDSYPPSVWCHSMIRMDLENRIPWPPTDQGVTFSFWIRILQSRRQDIMEFGRLGEAPRKLHLISIGTKENTVQVWLEGTTLVFRVCVDRENQTRYPYKLLAQARAGNLLRDGEWQHLVISYTESKLPDKSVFGKVHLTINCLIESDIVLEFDAPATTSTKSSGLFRHHTPASNTILFLGHRVESRSDEMAESITKAMIGNTLVFSQPRLSLRSIYCLLRLGPKLNSLLECLADSISLHPNKDYRIRFRRDWSPSVTSSKPPTSLLDGGKSNSPPPFLFQLLNQTTNPDQFFDEVIGADVSSNIKLLQETLVLTYSPNEPNVYYLYGVPTTSTKRRMLFRRADYHPNGSDFDSLTQSGSKHDVQISELPTSLEFFTFNRSLEQVGGIQVLLLLYAKVIELSSELHNPPNQPDFRYLESIQAKPLQTLLYLRSRDTRRRNEFCMENLAPMLHKVMTRDQCVIGFETLQLLFNNACSENVIVARPYEDSRMYYEVNTDNSAVIHDIDLLNNFILDWRIWHTSKNLQGEEDFSVWTLLFDALNNLTGDFHPYQSFNIKTLLSCGVVDRILNGVEEIIDERKPLITDVVMLIVSFIRNLLGSGQDIAILSSVADFLIAVNCPEDTFVCHASKNFYFSLGRVSNKPLTTAKTSPSDGAPQPGSCNNVNTAKCLPNLTTNKAGKSPPKKSLPDDTDWGCLNELDETDIEGKLPPIFEDQSCLFVTADDMQRVRGPQSTLTDILVASGGNNAATPDSDAPSFPSSTDEENKLNTEDQSSNKSFESSSSQHKYLTDNGISFLMSELLNLLSFALHTGNENQTSKLIGGALNDEIMLVLCHHHDAHVRTATICLFYAFFSRCTQDHQAQFLKKKGFHLIANQLHQHPVNRTLVEACLYLLIGRQISIDEPYAILECGIDSHNPFTNNGAVLLLSILDKCLLSPDNDGVELCRGLLNILIEVFQNMGPIADVMLDNGLTLALCKLLNAIGDNKNINEDSKQNLYHMVEHILTAVCVKSCSISGSGHFQVFEDLIVLLCSHEYEFILGGYKQPRHPAVVKKLTECLLFHIFDAMAESGGAIRKISAISRNASMLSVDPDDLLSPTPSDGCGHASSEFSTTAPFPPFKPANASISSQRRGESVSSLDFSSASGSIKNRSSSNLSMSRRTSSNRRTSFDFSSLANRSISGNFRSRSYRGNQRRKINEAESAQRVQHVLSIAVDRVIYSERSQATINSNAAAESPDSSASTDMTSSVSSSLSSSSSRNSKEGLPSGTGEREYRFVLFDVAVDWLMTVIETRKSSGTGSTKRKSTTSVSSAVGGGGGTGNVTGGNAWERIIKIAQNGIVEQVARLLVYFLSPSRHIKDRAFPLRMARFEKFESLIALILPQQSPYGEKVAVYLHLLLHNHKFSLTSEERADGKRMSKLVNKMGHRVSSQQRRAMHDSSEDEATQHHHFTARYDEEWNASAISWMNQMRSQYRLLASKTSRLADQVSTCAMQSTRDAVAQQNAQRKAAMVRMKESISNDLLIRKRWIALLEQLAHERAVWYNPDQYPQSWQLDSTEGPCRERRRLQRCNIDIDSRFMIRKNNGGGLQDATAATPRRKGAAFHNTTPRTRPLAFLFTDESHSRDSNAIRTRLQTNERIHKVQTCTNVTCACETAGELLIGETQMHFVADQPIVDPSLTQAIFGERELLSLSWQHGDVIEYHRRWWQLRDIALEIFLINGRTYLLAFSSTEDRDGVVDELAKLDLPNLNAMEDIQAITKQWCNGKIGNFEYLTKLNKEAGRSFNDLMQYPVAPFVLSDYTSQIIDLENISSYRILEKPISVQDASREKHFRDRYKFLDDDYKNCPDDEREMKTPPFHYGSHYSNSGTVLHFLVRLPPFTQLFLEYQDSSFDIPDRTFHSMETTYRLSSFASTTDVKELIPEFFFLPEFLCNLEGFDFGYRQCGVRVHHVTLPIWSKEDPRLFVLIHRQALESDHVTANLHKWIDLVFGHKQTGQAALDAVNVFHPATYFGMDPSTVTDPLKRVALETMVKTYGQTPKMLFTAPHPPRVAEQGGGEMISSSFLNTLRGTTDSRNLRKLRNLKAPRPLSSVKGLKWGDYVGSVGAPEPTVFLHKTVNGPIGSLVPLQTNDVCALAPNMSLLVVYARTKVGRGSGVRLTNDITWSALLTYDKPDGVIRLKLKHNSPGINLMRLSEDDNHVTCCAVTRDCTTIVFGTESGKIVVHRATVMTQKNCDLEILPSTSLYCHSSAITDISICDNFRFFVSASMDGTAAIWDVDTLAYVRSLTGHAGGVNALAISRTSGDICTVCDSGSSFHIRLWTINGSLVAAQDCRVPIRCVTFSNMEEGRNINVVAGGLENGTVRLWSTWDLSVVRDVTTQSVHQPIVSVAFTNNGMVLYAATQGGFLVGWCRQDKEKEKQPLLITFLETSKTAWG